MGFITINEGFVCSHCGEYNPPAERTCRNHCRKCLYSLHLDDEFPGDRKSTCGGKMKVVEILPDAKSDFVFVHECEKCGKRIKNKAAEDDSREEIFRLAKELAEKNVFKKF